VEATDAPDFEMYREKKGRLSPGFKSGLKGRRKVESGLQPPRKTASMLLPSGSSTKAA
jgi:hypothetical protein